MKKSNIDHSCPKQTWDDKLTEWYCIDEKPPNAWVPPPWKKPCDHANYSIEYRIDQENVLYCNDCKQYIEL